MRWANITTAAFMIGFTAMFFALIQFTTVVWQYGIVRAGLAMMPGAFVVMVLAPASGRLAARVGQLALLLPGGIVDAASGLLLIGVVRSEPAYLTHMLPAALVAGFGVSLVIPQLTSAAVQGLSPDEFGAGAAVNQANRQFGATFGVALTVALLGTITVGIAVGQFQRVWWLLVACGAVTTLAALALPHPARPAEPVLTPVPIGAER